MCALQAVHGLSRVITHISEISGCCFLLGWMRNSLHIVSLVACGGIGAVNNGLGSAWGLSAEVVLRWTPYYCTCMPEKQHGL